MNNNKMKPNQLLTLTEYIKFRTNPGVQSIVLKSINLFRVLVLECALFKLLQDEPDKLYNQQDLRLQACVECQKLRMVLRYEWLTNCLILAPFESDLVKSKTINVTGDLLPSKIMQDDLLRLNMFNSLALLMGHLLREHFLSLALEHLCRLIENHRLLPPSIGVDLVNKLTITVRLITKVNENGVELFSCNEPDKELKATFSFLVDELASVCDKLPRLETQLSSQSIDTSQEAISYIRVLQVGDNLLESVKSRLYNLVDRSLESRPFNWWIDPEYLEIIKLLNTLRLNEASGHTVSSQGPAELRLKQLEQECQQIDLINDQEMNLNCKHKRFYDYGYVLLDYEPLRLSLIQSLRKERLIMTRLVMDDLLKLMHRLRIQFDEIEVGVDLEYAIDDYIGERRHHHHQQQQLVLSSSESLDHFEDTLEQDSELKKNKEINNSGQAVIENDDEAFMNALTGNGTNTSANQQLMALSAPGNLVNSFSEQRVAPIVECQLLLEKYKFISELFNKELEPLKADVQVAFEGLIFLSEYVHAEQLEPTLPDLITDLANRSQDLTLVLSRALDRLNLSRNRLEHSNRTRSIVLSKLVLDFHLIMSEMSLRELQHTHARQLDSIQETTDWANQLESRFQFLFKQNSLLTNESHLLQESRLISDNTYAVNKSNNDDEEVKQYEEDSHCREELLNSWRQVVSWIASYWRLVERYETQQVKWLNSDTKRIDFLLLESTFQLYKQRWTNLKDRFSVELANTDLKHKLMLEKNLDELKARLEQFEFLRLPIFRFLTNRFLTEAHWSRLIELLSEERRGISSGSLLIQPQACTTLAQYLELNFDKYVDELKAMNQQAIIEQELSIFLELEAEKIRGTREKSAHLSALAISRAWFEGWTEQELKVAARRFIEMKLINSMDSDQPDISEDEREECRKLAERLVDTHALVKRHIRLRYSLNLDQPLGHLTGAHYEVNKLKDLKYFGRSKLILRTFQLLSSAEHVTPGLFIDFLKQATENWTISKRKLNLGIQQVEQNLETIMKHLTDIEYLILSVNELQQTDLKQASLDSEKILIHLERELANMELEREVLATKEALALERQREALATRDDCIRQITERAIPAIRAAAKALDCLDGRSLRALRSLRPHPPEPVRLVLEAVCLLRSSCIEHQQHNRKVGKTVYVDKTSSSLMKPERRFDPLLGVIIEDYWPAASRMLNGTHSSRFIADLRKVDKRSIPANLMRLIRSRYLNSSKFKLAQVSRVSIECSLLAKWLIAVDVFDRVINVVRPNYRRYMNADRHLSELLVEVNNRRRQIESICGELCELEDSFENKISHKMSLVESLDQCRQQLKQVESTRMELLRKKSACVTKIEHLKASQLSLMDRCVLRATRCVYLGAMRFEERKPMIRLLQEAPVNCVLREESQSTE